MSTPVEDPLQAGPSATLSPPAPTGPTGVWVDDTHARLNRTLVRRVERPTSTAALARLVRRAADAGEQLSIAGGRHAMGGQAFASGGVLIDTTGLDRVLALDPVRGTVRAQAGIQWPALVRWLVTAQGARAGTWGIRQKQTGADRLSLGGALAANVHGRGLCSRPLVEDVESLLLVDPRGRPWTCDRQREPWLFRRVIGGYGLFGVVAEVTLRLARRRKLVRLVRMLDGGDPVRALEAAADDGALFGDCQLAIDDRSSDFLRQGVVSTYHPVADELSVPAGQRALSEAAWRRLIRRAHTHKTPAFEEYAAHYRATSGQVYWSDLHQLGTYVDGYHDDVDRALGCAPGPPGTGGSEMITELYVPRTRLPRFLEALRSELRARSADVIYATVRLIEAERETALPWARRPWACLVLNLHTAHEPRALRRTADTFRALIDRALDQGGTYYLTYHRWARRDQLERGHPGLAALFRDKRAFDPDERFTSDWYRHHRALLGAGPRGRTPVPAGIMPPRRPPRSQPRGLP